MAKRRTNKIAVGVVLILSALFYLAFVGYEESKAYFRTVEEVTRITPDERSLRFKVGGNVEEESIEWRETGVDFKLVDGTHSLPVSYRGSDPVPDTFRDGSEAIVEGKLRDDGTFEAVKIQAKCASKYEAEYDYENHSLEGAGESPGGE